MISIIIPTYNRGSELIKSIGSVKAQTYQEWELIVVDDCSDDDTENIVKTYMKYDPRIRYYKKMINSGSPVIPRNLGVKLAKGEYIAFLDSDDAWTPNKLETQIWFMQYHDSSFTYHDLIVGDIEWSRMSTCHSDNVFKFLLRKNFIPTSSVMMKKDLYMKYEGMDFSLPINHDWDLWLKIAYENPIHYINAPMGFLRIHKGSVISQSHRRRVDSRKIIRKWKDKVDGVYYRKILAYYYLMEIFDILPKKIQKIARRIWYAQTKYKK